MKKVNVLGVEFDDISMDSAVERALSLIDERSGRYVVTPNPEIVMLAGEDKALLDALNSAALTLPDGIGVIKAAAILGTPIENGKLSGIDFGLELSKRLGSRGGSVFLFGAKPGVAEQAGQRLMALCPGLIIAGTADGYGGEDAPVLAAIERARPDLLLVCLGAPKQEYWMRSRQGELPVGLMAGLGGSLDVWAGVVQRAPLGWQKAGLEWLYRLIKEPRRLGRMMKLPKFILKARSEARAKNG